MTHQKYWFRQKTYGYGITPCSWQGWLVTLIYILVLILISVGITNQYENQPGVLIALSSVIILASVYIFLKLTKPVTQGELKWRWGK